MSKNNVSNHNNPIMPDQPGGIPGRNVGIPVIRVYVYACGTFAIHLLREVPNGDETQARYEILDFTSLRGRGPVPSETALKLFLHQPHCFAPTAWLREH